MRPSEGVELIEHIESETSFCYKKLLVYATMSKIESRCKALNGAMVGLGTDEKQLIRIILCSTLKERMLIRETYNTMYETDLIEHIESELSGDFKAAMVAILESDQYTDEPDYEEDANQLRDAIEGNADDEDAMIRIIARKTPEQIEAFKEKYEEVTGDNLYAKIDEQTDGIAVGLFTSDNFRTVMLNLLRPMPERMAHAVRYCVEGWGTDDTGLITCCVHLSEMQRNSLIETYSAIFERDVLEDIRNDTSGDYQEALLACVRPPVRTYCHALRSSMKGLGTSDELLINWMCICKDRMDEVREAFSTVFEGENLVDWLDGDLSGDYKDTCIRCAKRECLKFVGVEVACTAQAPPTMEEAVRRFNKTFNELCRKKKNNPDDDLVIPEESQQELGCAFLFWAARSSCAPNLDIMGLWDMTNAIGFPPGDDGPDLRATFREWDVSGTGEVDWNDFVHEMTTRVNDPNHFEADPLSED